MIKLIKNIIHIVAYIEITLFLLLVWPIVFISTWYAGYNIFQILCPFRHKCFSYCGKRSWRSEKGWSDNYKLDDTVMLTSLATNGLLLLITFAGVLLGYAIVTYWYVTLYVLASALGVGLLLIPIALSDILKNGDRNG